MVDSPSRRDVLAAGGGAIAGVAGGFFARPTLETALSLREPPDPVPFAWADTEWPFPDYDSARTRHPPAASAPGGDVSVAWTDEHSTSRHFTVVAANGAVFVGKPTGPHAHVEALDVRTGGRRWWAEAGGSMETPVAAPGDSVLAFGPERDDVRALAASTGDVRWERPASRQSLCVGGGRLFLTDWERERVTVRALDARTGDQDWATGVSARLGGEVAYDEATGRAFVNTLPAVFGIDAAAGSVEWRTELGGNGFSSGPVVASGRVFRGAFQSGLAALDAESGDVLWREPIDPDLVGEDDPQVARYYEVGAATDDVVLAVADRGDSDPGQLVAFDAASGDRRWTTSHTGETTVSKPTVVNGDVFVCVGGDARQELRRLDLADGTRTESWTLPTYGAGPVVAGGRVFVPTYDGVVALA